MDNGTDHNADAHSPARSKHSRSSRPRHTGDYPRSGSAKRRQTDKRRSRSSRQNEWSTAQLEKDCNHDEKHGGSPAGVTLHKRRMTRSREDSGYGDSDCNPAGSSSSYDQKPDAPKGDKPAHQSAKQTNRSGKKRSRHAQGSKNKNTKAPKLPWVPPPLPEHLRPIPQVTKIGYPFQAGRGYSVPLQNQFQNDGSFLEVFHQRMQAINALQLQQSVEMSLMSSSAGTMELSNMASAAASEPVVIKRRVSKPLKTGMVQKPKKRIDPCDPEAKDKDSWSLYMKEVNKYRANKCINSEACRPLMK